MEFAEWIFFTAVRVVFVQDTERERVRESHVKVSRAYQNGISFDRRTNSALAYALKHVREQLKQLTTFAHSLTRTHHIRDFLRGHFLELFHDSFRDD